MTDTTQHDPYAPRCAYAECGKPFRRIRSWQKFCSKECHNKHHIKRIQRGIQMLRASEQPPEDKQ